MLFKEFEHKKTTINIEAGKTISLDEYMLFNLENEQTDSMVGYGDVLTTTIVINSSENAKITLIAIVGEKENNEFKQKFVVSKKYDLDVVAKSV